MNIGELLKTKRAKTLMGFVYSWGASIVLIGALFKLQHWPYSGYFLGVGLITEAVIFFVSAFEPPLETPEWSRVYPELREDYEPDESIEELKPGRFSINNFLKDSEITPDLLDKVKVSLNELSNTARGISDISSATLATDMYVRNLNTASEAMSNFSEVNVKANQSINASIGQLIDVYESTTRQLSSSGQSLVEKLNRTGEELSVKIVESGTQLARTYKTASEKIETSVRQFGDTSTGYTDSLSKLSKNLSVLNQSIENQMKTAEEQQKAGQKYNDDLGRMNEVLASSIEELKRYRENATKLNQHLEALNTIYGNMLGAMQYKK
jgi:methyl-accepting chemotaxis protein